MAYRVIRPATHQEGLDERKKGIGSSEAGTVMGVMGVKKGAVEWILSYPRLNFGYKEFDFNPEFFKALEKTQSSLEDDIKIAMGEADTLVSPTGEVMALWKNTKPTMKFNAKAFQQADPAGYAKYMEPTASSRRFTVK